MPVETGKEKHPCSSHIHQRGGTCRKPPCHKGAACIGERVLNKETSFSGQFLNCVSLCGKLNVVTCWAQAQLTPCPQMGGHHGTTPGSAERGRERIPARAADASRVTAPVLPFKTVFSDFKRFIYTSHCYAQVNAIPVQPVAGTSSTSAYHHPPGSLQAWPNAATAARTCFGHPVTQRDLCK